MNFLKKNHFCQNTFKAFLAQTAQKTDVCSLKQLSKNKFAASFLFSKFLAESDIADGGGALVHVIFKRIYFFCNLFYMVILLLSRTLFKKNNSRLLYCNVRDCFYSYAYMLLISWKKSSHIKGMQIGKLLCNFSHTTNCVCMGLFSYKKYIVVLTLSQKWKFEVPMKKFRYMKIT